MTVKKCSTTIRIYCCQRQSAAHIIHGSLHETYSSIVERDATYLYGELCWFLFTFRYFLTFELNSWACYAAVGLGMCSIRLSLIFIFQFWKGFSIVCVVLSKPSHRRTAHQCEEMRCVSVCVKVLCKSPPKTKAKSRSDKVKINKNNNKKAHDMVQAVRDDGWRQREEKAHTRKER